LALPPLREQVPTVCATEGAAARIAPAANNAPSFVI